MSVGLVVDYGTAVIRAEAVDPESGKTLFRAECPNRLQTYGGDILSRIAAWEESEENREAIFNAAAEGLRDAVGLVTRESGPVARAIVAANTTHMYLLLRRAPSCIPRPPYALPLHAPEPAEGSTLGLDAVEQIRFVPCRANYLGGDVLCSLLAAGLDRAEAGSALLDLGVNGELAVTAGKTVYVGSCAAGCALGAGEFSGSELTAVTAELQAAGGLNRRGRLQSGADRRIAERRSPLTGRPMPSIAWGERTLYQSDLAAFLLAKASVAAMIDYIFDAAGIAPEKSSAFTLAGGLGNALDTAAAAAVGLLPGREYGRRQDTVLTGAKMLLLSPEARLRAAELYSRLHYVQLREVENYLELMLPHLQLPESPDPACEAGKTVL